jgi:hypothetical protein
MIKTYNHMSNTDKAPDYPQFFKELLRNGADITDSWLLPEKKMVFVVRRFSVFVIMRGRLKQCYQPSPSLPDLVKCVETGQSQVTGRPFPWRMAVDTVKKPQQQVLLIDALHLRMPYRLSYTKLNGSRVWLNYMHLFQMREAENSLLSRKPKGFDMNLETEGPWEPGSQMERDASWMCVYRGRAYEQMMLNRVRRNPPLTAADEIVES